LLWLLAINGGLLAVEGIVQRLEGSGRLLFFIQPRVNPGAETQFGPYAYRANASQFFNLLWPVCLGFWWTLVRATSRRSWRHHVPLLCTVLMAACPIISTSRGGAVLAFVLGIIATVFLSIAHWLDARPGAGRSRALIIGVWLFFAGFLGLGFSLGWKALKPRMDEFSQGLAGREEMFAAAQPMARDYPWFGTGPGSFEYVFQLYRISTSTYWPAQLHNDWLETRITFGWVGLALILAALLTVFLRWFAPGGIYGGRRFGFLLWLSLGAALIHARYDFPFQIHSLIFLFLVLCALGFNLSRRAH
jgi:O-antigen ligase